MSWIDNVNPLVEMTLPNVHESRGLAEHVNGKLTWEWHVNGELVLKQEGAVDGLGPE